LKAHSKPDSSLTLRGVFNGEVSPGLELSLEIGKISLILPRSRDFWTFQDSQEVVRNKKAISLAGRSGRYVRFRLMFGPFVLAQSRLKEPLVIANGKGTIFAGQIVVSKAGAG
jgi:hypothetical protein